MSHLPFDREWLPTIDLDVGVLKACALGAWVLHGELASSAAWGVQPVVGVHGVGERKHSQSRLPSAVHPPATPDEGQCRRYAESEKASRHS